jgi:hypothetical protein
VFIHTTGKLSAVLGSTDISLLPMDGTVQAMIILDGAYTDKSYRRQLDIDNNRSKDDISLDMSIPALLSLAGAKCTVTCQWSSALVSQYRFTHKFWEAFTHNYPLCNAVRFASSLESFSHTSAIPVVQDTKPSTKKVAKDSTSPKKKHTTDGKRKEALSKSASTADSEIEVLRTEISVEAEMDDVVLPVVMQPRLKNWVRYGRVTYGVGTMLFSAE